MLKRDVIILNAAMELFPGLPLTDALLQYAQQLEREIAEKENRDSEQYLRAVHKYNTAKILSRKADAELKKIQSAV